MSNKLLLQSIFYYNYYYNIIITIEIFMKLAFSKFWFGLSMYFKYLYFKCNISNIIIFYISAKHIKVFCILHFSETYISILYFKYKLLRLTIIILNYKIQNIFNLSIWNIKYQIFLCTLLKYKIQLYYKYNYITNTVFKIKVLAQPWFW